MKCIIKTDGQRFGDPPAPRKKPKVDKLIDKLVQKGIITREEADAI